MSISGHRLRLRLIQQPRWLKRLMLIGLDFTLLLTALWAAYSLRLSEFFIPDDWTTIVLMVAAPVIGVATFHVRGLYRLVTRYIEQEASTRIYITIGIAVLIWVLVVLLSGVGNAVVPRSVVIIYGLNAAFLIRLSRHAAGLLLKSMPGTTPASFDPRKRVAIYGAGDAGVQLVAALEGSERYKPIAFVDEDKSLWGQIINRLKVYQPAKIEKLVRRDGVKEIFLAIPSASRRKRRNVIRSVESLPVVVKTLPALADIASGQVQVSDLRPIDIDDLLGRDPVPPNRDLLANDIHNKCVMITGAGGSIGSELARQILMQGPARLVLLDHSEVALYEIETECIDKVEQLRSKPGTDGTGRPDTEIVSVLGSTLERQRMFAAIAENGIDTIYHAAAYKHVPLVEANPVMGLHNNTFGTLVTAEIARELGVGRFVLVSTDKAVRPTSVMGASKRLAELVLQGFAAEASGNTVFTMVRFGNVLGSSGSVVRRFRQQIERGGPVTVTHPDIIRYFMSIPEAAQLVLQAGAMSTGGDVFVLDMGAPVKIDDLARTMIRLSGLDVQDADQPDGDIAIEYVGLRAGEKLFEELLIGEQTTGTKHPRIMKNSEPSLSLARLREELDLLENAIAEDDAAAVRIILERCVEGYGEVQTPIEAEADEHEAWEPLSRTLH